MRAEQERAGRPLLDVDEGGASPAARTSAESLVSIAASAASRFEAETRRRGASSVQRDVRIVRAGAKRIDADGRQLADTLYASFSVPRSLRLQ